MRRAVLIAFVVGIVHGGFASADPPSFDCDRAEGTVENMICADSALARLDVRLDDVWRDVLARSKNNADFDLVEAEQRGWIKGRNECWKAEDVRECVETSYRMRIAELQARWRLVASRGPVYFACGDSAGSEIVATFFDTDPPTAILERGDETVVAFQQRSASGAKYEGRNVAFWTKGNEAIVTWGWQTEAFRCHAGK